MVSTQILAYCYGEWKPCFFFFPLVNTHTRRRSYLSSSYTTLDQSLVFSMNRKVPNSTNGLDIRNFDDIYVTLQKFKCNLAFKRTFQIQTPMFFKCLKRPLFLSYFQKHPYVFDKLKNLLVIIIPYNYHFVRPTLIQPPCHAIALGISTIVCSLAQYCSTSATAQYLILAQVLEY